MKTARLNTFETNSSSTHALCMLNESEMKQFENCEFFVESNGTTWTLEELVENYNCNEIDFNREVEITPHEMLLAVQEYIKGTDMTNETKQIYANHLKLHNFITDLDLYDHSRLVDLEYTLSTKKTLNETITAFAWEYYPC